MLVDLFFAGNTIEDSIASFLVLSIFVGGIISIGYLTLLARKKNV